jgi:hypothetical protein
MRISHYIFREVRRGFFRISHSRYNRTLSLRNRDNSICSGLYNLGTRTIAFACHYCPDLSYAGFDDLLPVPLQQHRESTPL